MVLYAVLMVVCVVVVSKSRGGASKDITATGCAPPQNIFTLACKTATQIASPLPVKPPLKYLHPCPYDRHPNILTLAHKTATQIS